MAPDIEEPTSDSTPPNRDHVHAAFDSWLEQHGNKVSDDDESRVQDLRQAAHNGDAELVKKHLEDVKEHSNWLYNELMKHPAVSEILQELSIMGF